MSTRSAIGIEHEDGTVAAVYCHFDGDISWNGKLLFENYTRDGVLSLLSKKKDLSSLGAKVTECCFYEEETPHKFKNQTEYFDRFGMGTEYRYLLTKEGNWVFRDDFCPTNSTKILSQELNILSLD